MSDTTLAKARALIEAHRKATPEPPAVRYVAATFDCDDGTRAYIRSVINDAPAIALALVEAVSLLRRWNALDGGSWHVDRHAHNKAELMDNTSDWLAKHGDGG